MATKEELIREHQHTDDERRKAEIEEELWQMAAPDDTKEYSKSGGEARRYYLKDLLGVTTHKSGSRRILFGAGADANRLWDEIQNNKLPLRTAGVLLKEARQLMFKDRRLKLDTAIQRVMELYNARPHQVILSDGTSFRRKETKYPEVDKAVPEKMERTSKKKELHFWDEMRKMTAEYFGKRLSGIDPQVRDKLWKEFVHDHDALIQEYQKRLGVADREARRGTKIMVTRTQVQKAARALSMDPPQPMKPADLTLAKKKKNAAVRIYHPDIAGATTRAKFEEVIESFSLLVRYNEQLESGEYHG